MNEPTFTEDWFSMLIPSWTAMLKDLPEYARILEIGAFEGRSTRWLLETFPRATVMTIDPFDSILGVDASEVENVYERFRHNIYPFGGRVLHFRDPSIRALPGLIEDGREFDFIYVDGSHHASDVIFDAVNCYRLLKVGGLMCFDDYVWGHPSVPQDQTPKVAIDAFLYSHVGRVKALGSNGRQMLVEKIG